MNYLNNNDFQKDLLVGQEAEKLFAEIAIAQLGATNIIYNTSSKLSELKKWDLQYTNSQGQNITFEIKNDLLSTSTGNFAVEFYGKYGASGIETTTANFWVILSGLKFYIFKTKDLKQLIIDNTFRNLQIKNGSAYVYLIPISKALKAVFKTINLT